MNAQLFDDIATKMSQNLPPLPSGIKKELEQSIRNILHKSFDKLELVTREEFEIQSAVLQKTRLKLEQLEQKLDTFEQQWEIK
jgi:BMFP domain-containing protein YqiC